MTRFTVRHAAIVVALAGGWISLTVGDHNRADVDLNAFYLQMAKADFRAAQKSIEDAVRLWPSNARLHGWRGYFNSQELPNECPSQGANLDDKVLEHVRQATADYRTALERNGRDAVARHNLGWLDHLRRQDESARQEFEQAIKADPETPVYRLSLGFFLEEIGDSTAASGQYVAAIERAPSILDSPFFARLREDFPDRAESILQQAITWAESRLANTNDPILEARLGKFYLYRHDLGRAGTLLESAASGLPNLPLVWLNLGDVRRLQARREEAWACYEKARYLDGSLAGPLLRIAEMYRESGQRALAIENFRTAAQKWSHVNPVTAAHNNRLYSGPPQIIDDLLPTTLVWYTSPCEASAAYTALAELMPDNRVYASRTSTCESLPAPHSGKMK